MAKKVKITKDGQTVYPATVMDAVVHKDLRVDSSTLIEEVNVSKIYPTGGIDGTNKYTLETAIAMIPASLRNVGIKCSFLSDAGDTESWEYKGGTFTSTASWRECGGRKFTELENKIGVLLPDNINSFNILSKSQMTLGKSINGSNGQEIVLSTGFFSPYFLVKGLEKVYSQVYANGGMVAYGENFEFIQEVSHNLLEYTLPDNAYYIRVYGNQAIFSGNSFFLYTKEYSSFVEYGITEDMIYTDKKISETKEVIDGVKSLISVRDTSNQYVNKINYITDFIDGIYLDSAGNEKASANACASVFIDVIGAEKFFSGAYAFGSVCGFDDSFNFVKTLPSSGGGFSGAYLIEEGIRYIRVSISDKANKNRIFIYLREEDLSIKTNIYNATYYEFGITYTDLSNRKKLDVIPTKLDRFHSMYINSINIFSKELIQEEGAFINTADGVTILKSGATTGQSYSYFMPVVGGQKISSNISSYGAILMYDKDKNFISTISAWKSDARTKDYVRTATLDINAAYIRFNLPIAQHGVACLAVGLDEIHKNYVFGEVFDIRFKRRGKKLVTVGDSLSYQRTWQDRLCELTGMWHNPKEVRGADESVKTEGYGYILLTSSLEDTDTYYDDVAGITKTEETVVDGFGYAHPIWTDAEGNKYRQPCRMAEGGETVMPVRETSIYSRASDSKYYKGDVIIVFAGANDKVTYLNKYPTTASLDKIQGVTNLKTDAEDITEATFEIYTGNEKLQSIGDYSDVGETTGIQKYNYTFRACFRGILKKVVDANPNAEIIVVGPFATLIKGNDYISRAYDYLTKVENEVIAECAREFSCQYIDLIPLFGRYNADRFFRGTDGTVYIHPTEEGGKKIAEYIASKL